MREGSSLPWVVVGDFNKLIHADVKVGGVPRHEGQMQLFQDALSYCDLFDRPRFFGFTFYLADHGY